MRPNEKFSGRQHSRHLCKDCARLGKEELDYRQAVRDLDRLLSAEGLLRRGKRRQLEEYLSHSSARVRAYALQIEMHDAWTRAEGRLYRDLEGVLVELAAERTWGRP